MKVVVLGGGPTGLAAAWDLARAGIGVEVLEKEHVVGGMSSSFERAGCILDYGTHGFHRSNLENQEIVDRMVELMGDDFIRLTRKAAIHFQGKYFDYPLRAKDIFFGLNPFVAFVCFVDFIATRVRRRAHIGGSEGNFEDWVVNRFGRRLYDIYFGPYTQKVWGIPPSRLTLSWAAQRIPSLSLWAVLKKALLGQGQRDESDEHSHSPYRDIFFYTERGARLMWEKLADRVRELGGVVRLDTEVTGIDCDRDMVRSVNVRAGGSPSKVYCDWLISTIPITKMAGMLKPAPSIEFLQKVRTLKYRAMVVMYIIVRKNQVSPYQWVYYSSDDIFFNRYSEFKNLTPKLMPQGKTVLCLETTCFEGDEVWNAPEEKVYTECMRGLERLGLVRKSEVEDHFLVKLPYAYPIADLEYERHFPDVLEYLRGYSNMLSVGRQGSFAYLNMDQSMEEGFRAAAMVIKSERGPSQGRPSGTNEAGGGATEEESAGVEAPGAGRESTEPGGDQGGS
jgi:protoporphyrinogen oxidase